MKLSRDSIRLSPQHPSLLPDLQPQQGPFAPLIVDAGGLLIDGYRRYRIDASAEFDAVEYPVEANIYDAARRLNLRTRTWDDAECFLWHRWARALNVDPGDLPVLRFPAVLFNADARLLAELASRRISLRQAAVIQQAPETYRPFFLRMLSRVLECNNNEAKEFIEMCCDLKQTSGVRAIDEVIPAALLEDAALDRRRKTQGVMDDLRARRYPRHTAKLQEFAGQWDSLNLGRGIQVAKSLFVERGRMEITVSAISPEDLQKKIEQLHKSLTSPTWQKIWD